MKLQLYKIEQEYLSIIESIIENDGEISLEQETALEINKENLEKKAICYSHIIKDLDSDISIIESEIKRLQGLKQARNKTIDKLKTNISNAMQIYSIDKIESPLMKISFRKSESIEIENQDLLDLDYIESKLVTTPNKAKIKKALESGEIVIGARIKHNLNLQIK